jgi:hypothetical protein
VIDSRWLRDYAENKKGMIVPVAQCLQLLFARRVVGLYSSNLGGGGGGGL